MQNRRASIVCCWFVVAGAAAVHAQSPSDLRARLSRDSTFLAAADAPAGASAGDTAAAMRLAQLRARLAELDSTYDMLLANDDVDGALRFAAAMRTHWVDLAGYPRALAQYRRALALAAPPSAARAVALNQAAMLAFRQLDQAGASALSNEAIRVGEQIGDKVAQANGYTGLARVALRKGDYAAVQRYAQQGLIIRESLGDATGLSGPMHLLAAGERLDGHLDEAARLYEFTLALAGLSGDRGRVAEEMLNLGYVRLHQGDTASAGRLFRESLRTYAALGQTDAVYLLGAMAALAAVQHQPLRAATLYGAMDAELERLKVKLDPDDQVEVDTYARLARSGTDAAAFDRTRGEGRTMSMRDAISLALQHVP